MVKFFLGIGYVWMALLWILAGLMHLWTIYIAYKTSGIFWGIINLFFPVISQLVWGFRAWATSGFDSPYIQWLIVLAGGWILYYVYFFIVSVLDNKPKLSQ